MLGTETRLLFSSGVSNLAVHHTVASPDRWGALTSLHKAEPLAPPIALIRVALLPSFVFLIGYARAMTDTHRTVRKVGGGTQVAATKQERSLPLNDPAISHASIDTMVRGLFKYFLGGIALALLGGARASRPAFNKYFFIKGLVWFLYYAIDNALSTPKARLIEYKSIQIDCDVFHTLRPCTGQE